jgi:hypothetical protein
MTISPKVLKGAIVRLDLPSLAAGFVVFQYNPDKVTRNLRVPGADEAGGNRSEATRLPGPPVETLSMDVEIDATDQLAQGDDITQKLGIYPQLSALETLIYPASSLMVTNFLASKLGSIVALPSLGPFTLLVWGLKRVVPVRLTKLNITEEAHDQSLNPLRAKVALEFRILTYQDLPESNLGHYISLINQIAKESFSILGSARNIDAVAGGNVKIF